MGKTTDQLVRLADDVSSVQPNREVDMLLSSGERITMALLCMALAELGVDAVSFTGSQAGMITDTVHTRAKILEVKGDRLRTTLAAGGVPVVAGFQGVSTDREVTTLGRGGSDTTAVALAAALGADACEIYTDVSGVFTTDPRIVPEARKLSRVSYEEMQEMAATGGRGAGAALGRVRTQPQRPAPRAVQLHLGAGHVGRQGGSVHGAGSRHRGDPRSVGGQGHRHRRARPSGPRRQALPRPGRQVHQRRHDRAERVAARDHRHLVHHPGVGPRREQRGVRGAGARARVPPA